MRGTSAGLLLAVATVLLGGCGAMLKPWIVNAPNRGDSIDAERHVIQPGPALWGIDRHVYVDVGSPPATLRLWIRDPVDRPTPRGTVLVLHGWRGESFWIRGTARQLAERGYRAVLVDLRGHGGSSGDYITFGTQESRDLVQVLDALHELDLAEGPVGVWGISTGAVTAIMWAAEDDRVRATVAVAPFTTMRQVVPQYVRIMMPLANLLSDADLEALAAEAADDAGFDIDDADALAAIRRVRTPVLIVHGLRDLFVPQWHGRAIQAAAPEVSEFVGVEFTTHLTAHFSNAVMAPSLDFFDRTLHNTHRTTTQDEPRP